MKRLIAILAFVLVLILTPSGKINSGLATTYFGYCDSAGVGTGSTNIYTTAYGCRAVAGYACPGTGAQAVKELGVNTSDDATPRIIYLGVYTTGGGLIVKTTTGKQATYPSTWVTWADTELTWVSGTTLTGGTTYLLAFGCTGAPIRLVGTVSTSGVSKSDGEDYSGGMPANLVAGTDDTMIFNVRCGVEPTGAPPSMINNILIIIGRFMGL
jgi:hypothetical protein